MAVQITASRSTDAATSSAPGPQGPGGRRSRALAWLEAHALFVIGVTVVLTLCLIGIPSHLQQDGWLALVAGRIVAEHGIPHHDYLTVMAHGVQWTDQQWLAQLLMYGLQQLGGLQLLTVAYVLITTAAFGFALFAARSLGAQDLHILMVLPAGCFFYLATAVEIRTQGFIYPLFAATIWLLASEFPRASRASERRTPPRWRAYLVFPILIVWANLHGSVTMAVGIVVVYGVSLLAAGAVRRGWRGLLALRPWSFIVLSPLTLIATPYGTSMFHYYSVTLMNSQFGRLVEEWRPVSSFMLLAIPLFILMAVAVGLLLRNIGRTPLFDYLLLGMLAVGAVIAVRNITWFGLACVILLPPAISRARRDRPAPLRRARINLIFAIVMLALTLITAVFALTRPDSWFQSSYPHSIVASVQRLAARDPGGRVFADVRYADWLVWEDPSLAGRIAYDTSLELLTPAQLRTVARVNGSPDAAAKAALRPYGVWVLFPGNHRADRMLLSTAGVHVVTRDKRVIIATNRSSGQAR